MSSPARGNTTAQQTTLLRVAATLVSQARVIVSCFAAGSIVGLVWSLLATPQYRAVARFAPEEPTNAPLPGGLASLAAQFGNLGGSRSLQFYADVLTGRDLIGGVAEDSFPDPDTAGVKRKLIDILNISGSPPERRLANVVKYLQRHVSTSVNDRTGTITLAVGLRNPELAAQVTNRLYERLERFNYNTRRSAASERRRFAERELLSARAELTAAEDALRDFLEANRGGLGSPRLAFQRDRLQRKIDVLQQVNSTLARELEEAKVAEVRDTPVFTLIQVAEPPVERDYPKRARMTLLGALLGAALAVAGLSFRASGWSAEALDPQGYAALRAAFRNPFSKRH